MKVNKLQQLKDLQSAQKNKINKIINRTWKKDIESHYHEQGKQRPWTTLGALHGPRVPFGTCFFGDLQSFF